MGVADVRPHLEVDAVLTHRVDLGAQLLQGVLPLGEGRKHARHLTQASYNVKQHWMMGGGENSTHMTQLIDGLLTSSVDHVASSRGLSAVQRWMYDAKALFRVMT
jgi:hypothetical protein